MSGTEDPPRTPTERDLVEDLVRIAESGPEIPAGEADRIKAAIRPQWQRQVRMRRTRRWAWATAAAMAVLAFGLVLTVGTGSFPGGEAEDVAVVEMVRGTVHVHPGGDRFEEISSATRTGPVTAGSEISTGGDCRAALRMASGHSLRVDEGTTVRLATADVVELRRGAVYVDSEGSGAGSIEVRTSIGVVREIGTRFSVRVDEEALTVAVRDGAVAVSGAGGEMEVSKGTAAEILADGSARRRALTAFDDEWYWVQLIAPPFDIEGSTVAAFLDWISAETGLGIRYSSPHVERFAADTVLHGSIGDMTPERTPEVVLASCGLTAVRDAGSLVISRKGE